MANPNLIPLDQAIKLRFINNLTYEEIAKKFNVKKPSVYEKLKPFKFLTENPEQITAYKNHRADLYAAAQLQILGTLTQLTESERKGLFLRQPGAMGLWFNSLFNNERLERGQSTGIQGYSTMQDGDLDSVLKARIANASRLGIRITDILVGDSAGDARDSVTKLIGQSQPNSDNYGEFCK